MQQRYVAVFVIIGWLAGVLVGGCVSAPQPKQRDVSERQFSASYDRVWEVLEMHVLDEMGCSVKKMNRKKGILITEWVHMIDTDGTQRWMLEVHVAESASGARVQVNKIVQMWDKKTQTLRKYNQESRQKAVDNKSWKKMKVDTLDIEHIYRSMDLKLSKMDRSVGEAAAK
ncbi:MAG: hypothetical protein GY868_16340 [Deltaproteobacteria bacterium]|nr:hypothetical protein [Deltaproteobacteria bacterium]